MPAPTGVNGERLLGELRRGIPLRETVSPSAPQPWELTNGAQIAYLCADDTDALYIRTAVEAKHDIIPDCAPRHGPRR